MFHWINPLTVDEQPIYNKLTAAGTIQAGSLPCIDRGGSFEGRSIESVSISSRHFSLIQIQGEIVKQATVGRYGPRLNTFKFNVSYMGKHDV
jgi:hypothetical protein